MTGITAMFFTRYSNSLSFLTRELRKQVTGIELCKVGLVHDIAKETRKGSGYEKVGFRLSTLTCSDLEVFCQDHFPVKKSLVVGYCDSTSLKHH